MKVSQKTVHTTKGPVVVHWITVNPKNLALSGNELVPAIADTANTVKKMEQIASSFRRIKNVSQNGIRGQETNDTVLVISRNKESPNLWEPLRIAERTLISFDAIEFTILANLVKENRLWIHKGYTRWFDVSPVKTELENRVVTRISNQRRLHYSVPKNTPPVKEIGKLRGGQLALHKDGWIPVTPTLFPNGYTNSFATLPELCKAEQAVAGLNAGYFLNMPEELDSIHGVMNDPVGLLMLNGKMLVPPTFTRSSLLINNQGKVFIRRISMKDIEVKINKIELQTPTFYTRTYGLFTPPDSTKTDLIITGQEIVEINEAPPTLIPQNGFIVSFDKKSPILNQIIDGLAVNRTVEYTLKLPRIFGTIVHAIAAGPQLLENGRKIPAYFFDREPLQEDFQAMNWAPTRFTLTVTDEKSRAPRSAIGITRDNEVLLVAIDDDRKVNLGMNERYSIGATLGELANIMVDLGCIDALNFDGGGSTTLFYDGKIVNRPSDGFPRVISTAILV